MEKRWKIQPAADTAVAALQQQLGIHPLFCKLLVQRGIVSFEQARRFFRPDLSHLHDPLLMKDMAIAVDRLTKAIQNKEKILLYGDYDVDGTTSIALMYSFLERYTGLLDYYMPDRYKEGYGVSLEGVEYAHQAGVSLIITLDCGIGAIQAIQRAKAYGIDVIVCDHHLPDEKRPDAIAILDPKQPDCAYPFKELSGCGVAFKFAQAYVETHDLDWRQLEDLLDFLVISIAADIVPIVDENRILASCGLQKLNVTARPGLKALIELSKRQRPLSISDIVFGLGPMINAAGRLADADQAVRLFLSKNKDVAFDYGRVLAHRNMLRKEFDQRIAVEAKALFQQNPYWASSRSIVLYQPHWHKGMVGIAAARMVEQFHRPTIILTQSGQMVVGSARSILGFDMHQALKMCEDLLISFGGHTHAAGLTLRPENVPFFQERFEAVADLMISDEMLVPTIEIASEISLKDLSPAFWNILKQFAPFGPGNMSPVFVARQVKDTGYSSVLNGNHLRLAIKQNDSAPFYGIAFDAGNWHAKIATKQPFDICFSLTENNWKDSSHLQLQVKDLKF